MMTNRTLRFLVVVVSLSLLVPLTMLAQQTLNVGVAKAQSQDVCTLETIAGTYLFHGEGVTVSEGEVLPYAEAGMVTFGRDGKGEGTVSASMDGEPFATRQAFTVTYEHVGNCVFSAVDEFDLQFDMYTTPAGTPLTYFSPGFSGVHLKQ